MKRMNGIPAETHPLLEATVLTGMTTGVIAGAIGGPPGAVAGGAIGAAIGAVTGNVLEREILAADRHNQELDEAVPAASLLRAEHARIEVICERLLDAYRAEDWTDVRVQWAIFEPTLRAHMKLEEDKIFPSFREADPAEAEYLLAEHDALRATLDVLGVNVELHAVTNLDANDLIERIRAHRAREERLLYPWVEETFNAVCIRA
jgi:hemerythrin superfamily protein